MQEALTMYHSDSVVCRQYQEVDHES
jgi:hypothetical protein